MKQTRNAITFLQAQYRALLQRVVWSRFAFISAFAGVCAPVVSSVVLAATPSGYAYTYTTSDYGLSHRMQDAYGVEQVCAEGADQRVEVAAAVDVVLLHVFIQSVTGQAVFFFVHEYREV